MKRILCWLKAIPSWVRCGKWYPHTYKEVSREPAIIITNEYGFRVSDNYIHENNETVHKDATLIVSKCKYCGKEELSWVKGKHLDLE